ncbi:endomembrane protein 70 subfamily protein [Cyclospora cayetanensis]|uniref:Transmembrane 9 superfamily member n=1 Tax=Cyclospora cayetanensis TaxID=88456 RepID=A0A1D3D6E4_9EIME|nr:endomembrane protein 70 subfamily protein [Cyclospora cayetanensis]
MSNRSRICAAAPPGRRYFFMRLSALLPLLTCALPPITADASRGEGVAAGEERISMTYSKDASTLYTNTAEDGAAGSGGSGQRAESLPATPEELQLQRELWDRHQREQREQQEAAAAITEGPFELCRMRLTEDALEELRVLVDNEFLVEAYVDGIPLVFPIVNKGVIVAASASHGPSPDGSVPAFTDITESLEMGAREVVFTYTVEWHDRPDIPTHLRLVLLPADEEVAELTLEETGWKLLHADVFRAPAHRNVLCVFLGSGLQLLLVCSLSVSALSFSALFPRASFLSFMLIGYLLTTFVCGFVSVNLYTKLGGQRWTWNIVSACGIFMFPAFVVWSILNVASALAGSTAALPVSSAFALIACLFFVTVPLLILGGVIGRRRALQQLAAGSAFPCRTNKLAREIPRVRWYRRPLLLSVVAAALPFSGIYMELYYLFLSVWTSSTVYTCSFLLLAALLLVLAVAAVSVLLTYLHLNAEDHRWHWPAFWSGGSVALYFLLHCALYFVNSPMTGTIQILHFTLYSLLLAWGLCLSLGCVSYFASSLFIKAVYSRIKADQAHGIRRLL